MRREEGGTRGQEMVHIDCLAYMSCMRMMLEKMYQ